MNLRKTVFCFLLLILFSNITCIAESVTHEYDELILKSIQGIKNEWAQLYSQNEEWYKDGYFEIKNTRLIKISDAPKALVEDSKGNIQEQSLDKYFGNIKYIIEFMILDNYMNSAPYYSSHSGRYNSVTIYDDLSIKVESHYSYFNTFSGKTYITDYSGIIEEVIDFGDRFNQSCNLLQKANPNEPAITFSDPELLRVVCEANALDSAHVVQSQLDLIRSIHYASQSAGTFSFTRIETLKDLEFFPNLEELVIDNHGYQIDLRGINTCKNLKRLVLNNCIINDIERLGDMPQLEELEIVSTHYGSQISNYEPLRYLVNLKKLTLINTANSYGGGNFDGSSLNNLSSLQYLTLDTGIVNYSLSSLTALRELNIVGYPLRNILNDLEASGAANNLIVLNCSLHELDRDEIQKIGILKNLEILDLGFDIYGDALSLNGIENLTNLRKLSVDTTYKFENIDALGKLPNLEELTIREHADLNGISFLNNITTLESLYISVRGDIKLSDIFALKNLRCISIDTFNSRELDLTGVEQLTSLEEISYFGMKVKSFMPLDRLSGIRVIERGLAGYEKVVYE